jgi:glycosyltransferase involved in cell wall biosynthesis
MLPAGLDLPARTSFPLSVVIPVYNGARYLPEALRSVGEQTVQPDQVIVVDDGSTDDSAQIAEMFPGVEVVRQENRGAGAARNAGLDRARNEWIAFLDADDVWYPHRLELQMRHLEQTSFDLSFGHVKIAQMQPGGGMKFEPALLPAPCATTFLGRRRHFEAVGKFTTDQCLGEFIEWMARAEEAGLRYQILPDAVAIRRLHDHNTGIRRGDRRSDYIHLVRTIMTRRQKAQSSARSPSP